MKAVFPAVCILFYFFNLQPLSFCIFYAVDEWQLSDETHTAVHIFSLNANPLILLPLQIFLGVKKTKKQNKKNKKKRILILLSLPRFLMTSLMHVRGWVHL